MAGRALVVGGGLAGLSAAIALANTGWAVTLAERDPHPEGSSIAITNRAVDALEALGVLDEAIAKGVTTRGRDTYFSYFYDGAGNPLSIPPPPRREDIRLPVSVNLLRADLTDILQAAARSAGADLRIGHGVASIEHGHDRVVACFEDGSEEAFALVVGADGSRSSVRVAHFPEAPQPSYTGHMSFRWLLPEAPPGPAGFYTLPDNSMIATTRLQDDLFYLSTGVDMPRRKVSGAEARDLLRAILDRFSAPLIVALRARLDDDQTIITRPYDWLLMATPWHRGRVVLIGDAVHSTTAHMASGGSLAIEDGVVLAQELGSEADISAGLQRFWRRRIDRATLVVDASVELLRLQQARADRAKSASLRASTTAALLQPY